MNKAQKIPKENLTCKIFSSSNLVITNSSLIACNSKYVLIADNKTEFVFHLLRKDGSYIGSYGKKGLGGNEFILISSLERYRGDTFLAYDINKRKAFELSVSQEKESLHWRELFADDSIFHVNILPIRDRFVTSGFYQDYRLYVLNKRGEIEHGFFEQPYRNEKERNYSPVSRSQVYQGIMSTDFSGRHIVRALLNANIISFYDVEKDGTLNCIKENIESYPAYDYNENGDYEGISANSKICYLSVCSNDKYVYALYSGKTFRKSINDSSQSKVIYVYDWKGRIVKIINVDKSLSKICMGANGNEIIAISDDPEPCLVRISI